jgi:hypothetical protein
MILTNEEERELVESGTWESYWQLREDDRRREKAFWNAWEQKYNREEIQWPF